MEDDEPRVLDRRMKFERDAHTGKIMAHWSMSREITTTFHRVPNITGFTWALTPDDVKELYYEEFRKVYSWPDSWEREILQRRPEPDEPGTGYSKNYGGSTSVAAKAQKLAKEKGVPISEVTYESFVSLHSKNEEFTYKRTADIAAKVKELADTQGENANMNDIFVNQVMGGYLDKKRRMVGTGDLGPSLVG
ncbi:hypothetical protein AAHA92_31784 [Salvia divinorum]|uniref:Uncharacterized protein n=1 Tax=Salvia divinorum TaxID=28513 RepID=A0ABD1FL52_SALDI